MDIKIQLDPLSRRFRWASELKNSHGNFLNGTIQIPSVLITEKHYRLELCLVPSSQVYSDDWFIHPNLLHLTKPVTFETVGSITKDSWRQLFTLDFYNGTISSSKKVTLHGLEKKGEQHEIRLGPDFVMLTIVKPLQQKQKPGLKPAATAVVSIEDVLSARVAFERYQHEDHRQKMEVSRLLAKYLPLGKKVEPEATDISELQRCRLRVCLYTMSNHLVAFGFSDDITNSGDKSLGLFAIHKMSSLHGFCTKGQWKTLITSQYNISPKVTFPKFVVELPNQILIDARDFFLAHFGVQFAQIDSAKVEVHNGVFEFDIPPQVDAQLIEILSNYDIKLFITLFRLSDGTYAQNAQPFRYIDCLAQLCTFCTMRNVLEYPNQENPQLEMPKIVWTEEDWNDSLEVFEKLANPSTTTTSGFESLERTLKARKRLPRKRKELPKSFRSNEGYTSDEESSVKKVKPEDDEITVMDTELVTDEDHPEMIFHPKKTIAARISGLFSKMKIGRAYQHFAYSI